jgi:phosphohistidine phosphatase
MELYFLRHGEASAAMGGDAERPLTPEGREVTTRVAERLAVMGLELDALLTSPLARAIETAGIIAATLDAESLLAVEPALAPGFDADQLPDLIASSAESDRVMLVGHEPDLSATVSALVGGGRIVMRKSGLARVDIPGTGSAGPGGVRGELRWLVPPDALGVTG